MSRMDAHPARGFRGPRTASFLLHDEARAARERGYAEAMTPDDLRVLQATCSEAEASAATVT